jgi:hypothetical protein
MISESKPPASSGAVNSPGRPTRHRPRASCSLGRAVPRNAGCSGRGVLTGGIRHHSAENHPAGYVEDHFPERGRVYSEPVILHVLTRDEHAQMLKNLFDRQITELEDLARRELELLEENERLERLDGAELQNEENRKRSSSRSRRKPKASAAWKTQAADGTVDEGRRPQRRHRQGNPAKNGGVPQVDAGTRREDIPKVREKLAESQEQSNTPEKSEEDVEQAVEQQKQGRRENAGGHREGERRQPPFEAGTFINRLKKAAGEQNGIVASLKEAFDRMLGLKTPALDPSDSADSMTTRASRRKPRPTCAGSRKTSAIFTPAPRPRRSSDHG